MEKRKPLTDESGEVRELMQNDYNDAKPFAALPALLQSKLTSLRGRPKAAVTKERISIRLSPEVVEKFRASGDGWQTRIDTALKEWLETHHNAI